MKESVKISFHCNPYDGNHEKSRSLCIGYTAVSDKGCNVYEIIISNSFSYLLNFFSDKIMPFVIHDFFFFF